MIENQTERTLIRLEAEKLTTRLGLAVTLTIGRALYRGEARAWFERVAEQREVHLRGVDANTRHRLAVP